MLSCCIKFNHFLITSTIVCHVFFNLNKPVTYVIVCHGIEQHLDTVN